MIANIVVDKRELSEAIYEEANSRTGRSNHFCDRLMA
jgi:hypothetical protein